MKIAESPLGDWVKWDTGQTVTAYARRMMGGNYWGGGIEIACCVRMKKVNIHVYEARGTIVLFHTILILLFV